MRLLQISDPHFGTEQVPVVAALQQLARDLRPDQLVLSGDVTQRARPTQFAAAREFVDSLGVKSWLALPGNHDIPLFNLFLRAFRPYANYSRAFGDVLEPESVREDAMVLAVNTTRRHRHKHGEVNAHQIARVAKRLAQAKSEQLRIVVVHQPMHVPREADEENLLRNAQEAARTWAAAGADLVLGGHIHLPYVLPMSERYDGLSRELWCVQAGTAVSARVRWEAPNSVNVIDYPSSLRGRECVVTRYDYASTDEHSVLGQFARHSEHRIALQR